MNYGDTYLDQVRRLNVNRSGERRAPHKPLLLLVGISKLLQGEKELPFSEVESLLTPLLQAYAPPVQGRMASLRASAGHLDERFAAALVADPALLQATVATLLEEHFPESTRTFSPPLV